MCVHSCGCGRKHIFEAHLERALIAFLLGKCPDFGCNPVLTYLGVRPLKSSMLVWTRLWLHSKLGTIPYSFGHEIR